MPVSASGAEQGFKAGFAQIELKQAAHLGFVFDNENGGLDHQRQVGVEGAPWAASPRRRRLLLDGLGGRYGCSAIFDSPFSEGEK